MYNKKNQGKNIKNISYMYILIINIKVLEILYEGLAWNIS